MSDEPDRSGLPIADRAAHETEMDRLRQERDALRVWLAGQVSVPHGHLSAATLRRKRQWCQVQRVQARMQRLQARARHREPTGGTP